MPYTFHADPGHAWLEVPVTDVYELGLRLDDFSPYSYMHANHVYLEEDCDAGVFLNMYRERKGMNPAIDEKWVDHDHPIRTYKRIHTSSAYRGK